MTTIGAAQRHKKDCRKCKEERHTLAACSRANHFPDFDRDGSKATLVVSLEFALIEDLNLELSGIADDATEG